MRDNVRKELSRRGYVNGAKPKTNRQGGFFLRRDPGDIEEVRLKKRLQDLDKLMAQDWSYLFPEGEQERRFYVYAHVHPYKRRICKGGEFELTMQGEPFYIGKGTGRRAWDLNRNEGHGVELRQLRNMGLSDSEIVCIIRDNLTEREALEIESKLIYFFGTKFESGRDGKLVNLDFPARPAPIGSCQ